MPPPDVEKMYPDSVALKTQSEAIFNRWVESMEGQEKKIARIVQDKLHRRQKEVKLYAQGTYNRSYRVELQAQGADDVLVRFAAPGRSMFPKEKMRGEIAVMRYLRRKTSIPVPDVLGSGYALGAPYMITEFVQGKPLSEYLKAPEGSPHASELGNDVLNPEIDITTLRRAYRIMADITVQLSQCRFPRIGNLFEYNYGDINVNARPMTFNRNEIVELGNVDFERFSNTQFTTTTSYLVDLANDHLIHLETQRNDAVVDEEDCRKKYIARCLFRQIVRFMWKENDKGWFPLCCDELHPSNVLVNEDFKVTGVIDWEFTYAAPEQLAFRPPSWLLLRKPDLWDGGGIDDFLAKYKTRLLCFLEELREAEAQFEKNSGRRIHLADKMKGPFTNRHLFFYLAATSGYALDEIFWKYIYSSFYGHLPPGLDIVQLLREEESGRIDSLVQEKMQQMKEGGFDKRLHPYTGTESFQLS